MFTCFLNDLLTFQYQKSQTLGAKIVYFKVSLLPHHGFSESNDWTLIYFSTTHINLPIQVKIWTFKCFFNNLLTYKYQKSQPLGYQTMYFKASLLPHGGYSESNDWKCIYFINAHIKLSIQLKIWMFKCILNDLRYTCIKKS